MLPDKICAKMELLGEEEVAVWFREAWGGENGTWMNGLLMPGCVLHNNALEATWKWMKSNICQKGGRKSTLPVFTLGMLRHVADQSRCAEQFLKKSGHPNIFPKEPVIPKTAWTAVQTMSTDVLLGMHVLEGRPAKFLTFLNAVQHADVPNLYQNIRTLPKSLAKEDLRSIMFPTNRALKHLNQPDEASQDEALARSMIIIEDYKNLVDRPEETDMGIDEILKTLSHYHVLTQQSTPWSSYIKFNCSCPDFYKCGACEHAIMTSMLIDRTIEIPVNMCSRKPESVVQSIVQDAEVAGSSGEEDDGYPESPIHPRRELRPTVQVCAPPLSLSCPPPPLFRCPPPSVPVLCKVCYVIVHVTLHIRGVTSPSGPVFAGDYSATRRNPTTGRRGGPTSFTGWEAETEGQVHSIVVPRASGGVAGGINLIAASEKLLPAVEEPQIARYDFSFVRHKFDFSKTANGLFFGTNMHTFRQRSECL